ncbi:MAG: DNA repair protein RadC [Verrucomicrobiae bacterium]|nr:DNA repair protein RadC [Verrucomicrobiae bacterium]
MRLRETSAQDPQSRLCAAGAAALSDAELVGALLGNPDTAATVLTRLGGLERLARATLPDLVSIPGIGPAAASRLRAAVELSVRLARRRAATVKLDDASRIADLLGPEMRGLQQESARVVLLDAKLPLIAVEEVSRGLLDQALIHSREVFAPAIARRAYAIVLVHNHPSGDPTPSEADIRITRVLKESSKVLDVPLLDHVIIGTPSAAFPEGWFSFKAAEYI